MAIFFGALGFLAGSFAFMVSVLRHAPEGYQDEDGFHFIQQPPVSIGDLPSQERPLPLSARRVA